MDAVFMNPPETEHEIEGYLAKGDVEEFYRLLSNPAGYGEEQLRKRVTFSETGQDAGMTVTDFSEEDRLGSKQHLCFVYANGASICCYAPLIVYAIAFEWWRELEAMINAGFEIGLPMKMIIAENEPGRYEYKNPLSLDAVSILVNKDMEKKLFTKCMEHLLGCRKSKYRPLINLQNVFYDFRYSNNCKGRCTEIPFIRPVDADRLKRNLLYAHKKFPELFSGTQYTKYNHIAIIPPGLLLDILPVFLKIYKDDPKQQEQMLNLGWMYLEQLGKNYAVYRQRRGFVFCNVDKKTPDRDLAELLESGKMKQRVGRLEKGCREEMCKNFERFRTQLIFWISRELAFCFDMFDNNDIKNEHIRNLVNTGQWNSNAETVRQVFIEFADEMAKEMTNGIGGDIMLLLNTYKMLNSQKLVLDLGEAKERDLTNTIFKLLVRQERRDDMDDEGGLDDRFGLMAVLEQLEFKDCPGGIAKKAMENTLMQVFVQGNEELVRIILRKDLVRPEFAGEVAEKLAKGERKKLVPMLLLKKYGII